MNKRSTNRTDYSSKQSDKHNEDITKTINFLDELYKTKKDIKQLIAKVQYTDVTSDIFSDWWRSSSIGRIVSDFKNVSVGEGFKSIFLNGLRTVGSVIGSVAGVLGFESLLPSWLQSNNYKNQKLRDQNKEIVMEKLQNQLEDIMEDILAKKENLISVNGEYLSKKISQIDNNNQSFVFNADSEEARNQFKEKASRLNSQYETARRNQDLIMTNNKGRLTQEQLDQYKQQARNTVDKFMYDPLADQLAIDKENNNNG